MENKSIKGHLLALFTITVWGTTFISTKVLLTEMKPVEILFIRFILGLIALYIACPRRLKDTTPKQELMFAAAGLCGISLYYLFENIALTYTMASNVAVFVSVAPFFTVLLTHIFLKDEKRPWFGFFLGFAVAMTGISLISLNGARLKLNPLGDLLALLAAFIWGCYSVLSKKISAYGYNTILTTRRIFIYGILFMLPTLIFSDFGEGLYRLAEPLCLINIIYLGLGASALCFVTWNMAVGIIGPIRTSVYIYVQPVITIIISAVVLGEPVTPLSLLGTLLAVAGLFISESNGRSDHGNRQ